MMSERLLDRETVEICATMATDCFPHFTDTRQREAMFDGLTKLAEAIIRTRPTDTTKEEIGK